MNHELYDNLHELAIKRSVPFCMSCYHEAPRGRCETCGTDDLARLLAGHGVDWNSEFIIKHILETELITVDLEESFEEMVRECYPETTKVAWTEFDTFDLLKSQDPISWRCALADFEGQETDAGTITSFDNGNTYYRVEDVERLVEF